MNDKITKISHIENRHWKYCGENNWYSGKQGDKYKITWPLSLFNCKQTVAIYFQRYDTPGKMS